MGDMAYNLSTSDGQDGNDFLKMIEPIATQFAYMTVPGNHEGYENFTQYKNRLNMPSNGANNGTSYFYSLNIGRAHIIMYNSNAYFLPTGSYEGEV